MTIKEMQNFETVARMLAIDNQLTNYFIDVDTERLKAFNATVSRLQWEQADKDLLTEEDRPAYAYNIISPVLKYISGLERGNRKKMGVVGVTDMDQEFATLMNSTADFYMRKSRYERNLSKTFVDALIARWGWMYTGWDFSEDKYGMLLTKHVNPFRIKFNLEETSDISLKENRYLEDTVWLTLEEIIEKYAIVDGTADESMIDLMKEKSEPYFIMEPQKTERHTSTFLSRIYGAVAQMMGGKVDEIRDMNKDMRYFNPSTGQFKVIEMHERRLAKKIFISEGGIPETERDITNVVMDKLGKIDSARMQLIRQQFNAPFIEKRYQKEIWMTACVPAFEMVVADDPYPVQNGNFAFTPMFAYDFHADLGKSQSVVDELIDPQSSYNKRRSTMLEIVTRFAVKGWVAEDDAIQEYLDEWENRRVGSVRRVKQGKINAVKEDQNINMPQGLTQLEQEDLASVEYITSINRNARGFQESSQETGRLFLAKRQQTDMMQQYLFDNKDHAELEIMRNIIDNIQFYATEERVIRITEDLDNPQYIKVNQRTPAGIINDVSKGKFDIAISKQPYGANAKEIEYMKFMDTFQFILQYDPAAAQKLTPLLLEISGTPYAQKALELLSQSSPQEQAQAAQMQKMAELEIRDKNADVENKVQKAIGEAIKNSEAMREAEGEKILQDSIKEAVGL